MVQIIKSDGIYLTAEEVDNLKPVEKDGVTLYYIECKQVKPEYSHEQKELVADMIRNRKRKSEIRKALGCSEYMLKQLLQNWFGTRNISKIYTDVLKLKYKYQRRKKQEIDPKLMKEVAQELDNKIEQEMADARTRFEGSSKLIESNNQ
jgi:hypothetical protein